VRGLLDHLEKAIGLLVGALLAVALCLAVYGVGTRYLAPAFAIDWISEVAVFIAIWAIMLSVARVERHGAHVRFELLLGHVGPSARRLAELVAIAVGFAVAALLVASGYEVVNQAIAWDERTSSSLRVPLWIYYASLGVGFALQLVFLAERLADALRGRVRALGSGTD
jgi:TRAP-type C4-dicarboxylate transport system permease small subunit